MTTMLETLQETANAYTSETFAVVCNHPSKTTCQYLTDDGRMCAIGRCMLNPEDFPNTEPVRDIYKRGGDDLDSLLKPEYRGFPIKFWTRLQDLHDTSTNWDAQGLTPIGRRQVRYIVEDLTIT